VSKKRTVLVSVLMVALVPVLLLTVGGVATVMADEPTPPPEVEVEANANGLLTRVAQILDIPEDDLIGAFKQARQEMRQETFIRFLDRALGNERITQEEYDAIIAWGEQRPAGLASPVPPAFGARALGGRHMWSAHNRYMWGGHRGWGLTGTPELAD